LGNPEKRDSFSKECIDTINLNLTEKKNFICIVAGYSHEIDECFFSYNPGLRRRFPFGYEINEYNSEDLRKIFVFKIEKSGWKLNDEIMENMNILDKFIDDKKSSFTNHAGDIDNLILNIKIVHGKRIFGKNPNLKGIIIMDDIIKAFDRFVINKGHNKDGIDECIFQSMYN
jgi:hypothetical protein